MIFARKDRVSYIEWTECMNLVEFHHLNASCKLSPNCLEYLSECLEQLSESLGVLLSPSMFSRVPKWHADSFPGDGLT
jgi:putative component of membrane protein insertase Oxa1/YidC/SpoIIIJ protein YidD